MKEKEDQEAKNYFFVDESGDANFYNRHGQFIVGKEGCSRILLLGFIRTSDPEALRSAMNKLKNEMQEDKYLASIPSMKKTFVSFHAKDDCAEVREKVFKTIVQLNFKAEFIVARKLETIFSKRHQSAENVFYDDLVAKLFENQLHKSNETVIYFSTRGDRLRNDHLSEALQTAKLTFENKWKVKVDSDLKIFSQNAVGEPCLQIIDYMNWAVQRAFIKKEDRFLKFVEDKISLIVDIYDFKKYPKNYYNRKNKFDINEISPL